MELCPVDAIVRNSPPVLENLVVSTVRGRVHRLSDRGLRKDANGADSTEGLGTDGLQRGAPKADSGAGKGRGSGKNQ